MKVLITLTKFKWKTKLISEYGYVMDWLDQTDQSHWMDKDNEMCRWINADEWGTNE